jgi:hypothetical protein
MPYKIYKKNGYKVCKPGEKKCFSKKSLDKQTAEDQQKALYASTNESISENTVGYNLEFKNITFPNKNKAALTYHYKSKKDSIDLILYYVLGKTPEEVDYLHAIIKDNNDVHSKGQKFEDPQSPELSSFASSKNIKINSEDIEMAGQDALERIETYYSPAGTADEFYEESLTFESLCSKIFSVE